MKEIEKKFKERIKNNEEISSLRNTFKKLEDIASIDSTNEKVDYLKSNYDYSLYRVLVFLLESSKTRLTKVNISKEIDMSPEEAKDTLKQMTEMDKVEDIRIFDVINYLTNAKGIKKKEIGAIQFYISLLPEDLQENVKSLLIKDLKITLGQRKMEEVFPSAFSDEKNDDMMILNKHQTQNGKAFEFDRTIGKKVTITEKIDGVRMNIYVKDDKILTLTRQGKEKRLPEIERQLIDVVKKLNLGHVMFDGEVTLNFSNVKDFYNFLLEERVHFLAVQKAKETKLTKSKITKELNKLKEVEEEVADNSLVKKYQNYLVAYENVKKSYFETFEQLEKKIKTYEKNIKTISLWKKEEGITEEITKICSSFRKDVFKITSGKINNKDFAGDGSFNYNLFDIFFEDDQKKIYSQRREVLNKVYDLNMLNITKPKVYLENDFLSQYKYEEILTHFKSYGKEGAMVNIDAAPYSYRTRGYNIMKIKREKSYDLRCIGFELSNKKNKQGKIGAYIVELFDKKNNTINNVKVSGLTKKQEEVEFFEKNVRNNIAEIGFTEVSNDKKGKLSLGHPRFIRVRDDKTEPSQD